MISLYFKNLLNLLKSSTETFNLFCNNDNELIISVKTIDIDYYFHFISKNTLIPKQSYIISLIDIHRLFKYIKSDSVITFNQHDGLVVNIYNDCSPKHKNNKSVNQSITLPIIYTTQREPFVLSPTIQTEVGIEIYLNDLSRVLKSLKNTSDFYKITLEGIELIFSNIEAVIPITYRLKNNNETELPHCSITITNNTLLKLNKLPCNNKTVIVSFNREGFYISQEIENEINYFLLLRPLPAFVKEV